MEAGSRLTRSGLRGSMSREKQPDGRHVSGVNRRSVRRAASLRWRMTSQSQHTGVPDRLYAHWLDGEWQKIAYPVVVEGSDSSLRDIAEGALKLHALFGTRIGISDVQLSDSEVMLRLFATPEFRKYLASDEEFLTLVAHPRDGISDPRLARATRGIARSFEPGWMTSLPNVDVDTIRRFAEPILGADNLDIAHCITDRSKGPGRVIAACSPEHAELFEGMLRGICHFAKRSGGPSDTPSASPRPPPWHSRQRLPPASIAPTPTAPVDRWDSRQKASGGETRGWG